MNTALLISIVGLLLVTVHATEHGGCRPRCEKNEEWTECGTACPKTCKDPNPGACTKQCVIGCQCKEGFVLNNRGKCIRPSECCEKNEEWTECGTACPKTCKDDGKPKACTLQCVIGCQCKEGFVLNSSGKCIPPSDCCSD